MDVKKIALLVGALVIAAFSAVMARSLFAGGGTAAPTAQAAAMPEAVGPEILVATRPLAVGTIIEPDSFRYQPWPKDLVDAAYFVRGDVDPATLAGTVVRFAVTAGQPVTKGALVQPGDRGFLAAALGPGMRAITVSVSTESGVAGFVFPGDRVDLMLTQTVEGEGTPLRVTETVLRNLRVLATDQRTATDDAEGRAEVRTFSNVTLEVTPRIAEKITVAQTAGQLALSLRSIADNAGELEAAIASGAVDVPEGDDPAAERRMMARAAAAPEDGGGSFATGGDVSRFQRRSVPAQPQSAPAMATVVAPADGSAGTASSSAASRGPVIRVARGNTVTEVPVGGR